MLTTPTSVPVAPECLRFQVVFEIMLYLFVHVYVLEYVFEIMLYVHAVHVYVPQNRTRVPWYTYWSTYTCVYQMVRTIMVLEYHYGTHVYQRTMVLYGMS